MQQAESLLMIGENDMKINILTVLIFSLIAQSIFAEQYANTDDIKVSKNNFAAIPERNINGTRTFTNSLGMAFVSVPGTTVLFSRFETRVKDFQAFVKATGYDATMFDIGKAFTEMKEAGILNKDFPMPPEKWEQAAITWTTPAFPQGPTHPVCYVDWNDAQAFCLWLTKKEQQERVIGSGEFYRLPRDWEWSVAIGLDEPRNGSPKEKEGRIKGVSPWGSNPVPPHRIGNLAGTELRKIKEFECDFLTMGIYGYTDDYIRTAPVGSFNPNQYGLFDMVGNVWEWCEDSYDGTDNSRIIRGCSWRKCPQRFLLSSGRFVARRTMRDEDHGFRVVLSDALSDKVSNTDKTLNSDSLKRLQSSRHKSHEVATNIKDPKSMGDIIEILAVIRENFISALLEGNGVAAQNEQREFAEYERCFPDLFDKGRQLYKLNLPVRQNSQSNQRFVGLFKTFVWDTIYEDALKVGLNNENIRAILDASPLEQKSLSTVQDTSESRLRKLKDLKEKELISDDEYWRKRKIILDEL
jgi:formylglycine-generating enzyme required for sulfatase activity